MDLYLAAACKIEEERRSVADVKVPTWPDTTKAMREACDAALDELNRHRAEHGCQLLSRYPT
jgi:hypothetical protein